MHVNDGWLQLLVAPSTNFSLVLSRESHVHEIRHYAVDSVPYTTMSDFLSEYMIYS